METKLAFVAAAWGIAMALGPLLQIRKMVVQRTSTTISMGYFVVLLVGFVLWIAYGVAADNWALIVPNTVAAIVSVATIIVAQRYRSSAPSSESSSRFRSSPPA